MVKCRQLTKSTYLYSILAYLFVVMKAMSTKYYVINNISIKRPFYQSILYLIAHYIGFAQRTYFSRKCHIIFWKMLKGLGHLNSSHCNDHLLLQTAKSLFQIMLTYLQQYLDNRIQITALITEQNVWLLRQIECLSNQMIFSVITAN